MRKAVRTVLLSVLTVLLLVPLTTYAVVPYYMTYQGTLRDSSGNLVTGTKSMTFKIYDASTAGTEKASFGPTSITASNGQYTAQLGPISSPTTVFDGNERWLEIVVESETLSPRLKINSVAYAIKADSAASADTVAAGSISGSSLAGNIAIATSGNISTTGTASAETLKINKFQTGGTGTGFCVGTGSIPAGGNNSSAISNSNVTDNSMIFVAPTTRTAATYEALTANTISALAGTFKVGLINSSITTPVTIDFNYLIIN